MVCLVGSGRMAVMARLLEAGSISPNITEEVGYQKLAVQYIYRELRGADEANLLDEEDMHVFGLNPMADPLHLVCCNACKKPVKTSQYAAHAELCRLLKTTEDTVMELDGSTGHRKPPRKERKKSLAACSNQPTPIGELERSEIIDADDATSSEHIGGQIGMMSSLTMDAKSAPYLMDSSGISPNITYQSTSIVPPSAKRFKLKAGVCLPLPHDPKTVSGMTKIPITHDLHASRNSPRETVSGSEMPDDKQDHEQCLLTKDLPVPLSTKIYYSQRNSRLRLAISHQYFVTSTEQFFSEMQESCLQKPDPILAQSSQVCASKPVGCVPSNDISNQHPIDNISRSQAVSVGMTRNKYVSQPYSFAGSSGKLLGPMQPPNGSVPVV